MPDRIDWLGIVRTHLPVVTGDAARDEDIAEELAQHLALRFDEARRAGAGEEAARAAALDELRNSAAIRSAIADAERKRPAAPVRQKKPPHATATVKPAPRPAATVRAMPASIGATALQTQFEVEPIARHVVRPVENVVVPISRRLQLIQLNERTCKWPNGDPLSEDFNFCGNDAAESGPYCTYHARIAFQPASERRRQR